MKYLYFLVLLLLVTFRLQAQEAPNMNNNVTGSSASVASGKQVNIPVNHFTGIPEINFPIHSYSRSGIASDVSLNYIGGGIKVDEPATSVGVGWQISAGGMITRNIRSLPDDYPGKGFMYTPEVDPGPASGRNATRYSWDKYGKDEIDSEQDIYQFNVGGRSGSFVIGKNGKIVMIPRQNIKVRYKLGNITGANGIITEFTLILEDGSRYLFSNTEVTTRHFSSYDSWLPFVSAWHLTSATSTYGEDTIRFAYKSVLNAKYIKTGASRFEASGQTTVNYNDSLYVRVDEKYLEKIQYPYGVTLNFNYDTAERADAKGEYALKNIELRDSVLRMGYKFDYSYFSNIGTVYPYGSTNAAISKLRLDKMTVYTQFRTYLPTEFSYSSLVVPKIGSFAQDHWGYFNNKFNFGLIPAMGSYSGANRDPDSTYARSGMLTGIKYPNGSQYSIFYEANDRKYYFSQTKASSTIGGNSTTSASGSFTVTKYSASTSQLYVLVARQNHCPSKITLKNSANQTIDTFSTDGGALGLGKTFDLPGGTYTLSIVPINSCGTTEIPACSLSWLNDSQDSTYMVMGGVRVKQIVSQENLNGAPPQIRNFKYVQENGTSSGFAFFIPKYDYTFTINKRIAPYDYFVRVSHPLNNMDYIWGASVGYSRVEESVPGNGKVVHEFSTYKDLNYFPSPPQFPFAEEMYPSWELGLPKKITKIDLYNQVKEIAENKYDFNVTPLTDTAFKSVKLMADVHSYSSQNTFIGTGYEEDTYYAITGHALLDSSIQKLISGTDTLIQSTSYTYDSLNNLVNTRQRESKDLQKFRETRVYYPYNYTLTGPLKQLRDSGTIVKVAEETWIKTPTSEQMVSASIVGYENVTGTKVKPKYIYELQSDSPVPLATIGAFNPALLVRNSTLMPLLSTIERYDGKLVPLQTVNNQTGIRQSIIWDDAIQQPVATIDDAAYSEVAYTSFEGSNNGNWTVPAGQYYYSDAMTGTRAYRLNGTISATVTAGREYTVTYWTMGAGITIAGVAAEKIGTERAWNLYRNKLPATTSTISLTASNLVIDELRAYPSDGQMVTSNFDFFGNVISSSSLNNKILYNEYDDMGRPRLKKDVEGNILEMNCYGLAGEKVNCNILYKNNAISRSFVQTNCTGGSAIPDTVVYTVAAGTYSSGISQYKADSLAMATVIVNGQNYANTNGTCGVIYAKIYYEDVDLDRTEDVVVKFYSDAALTKPKKVTNLNLVVGINNTCETVPDEYSIANGYQTVIKYGLIRDYEKTECDPPGYPCWTFQCHIDYVLKPGGYIIK
ncbi:DUF5977 domain-containing protein [Chitinophaga rhizophila]|uniref:DUF5977 domain-containing protein n=1 Tax=Chitinophaga rhizophila TaxID=2866212 RepID=A0ABS7G8L2_9BACT|nr:DUF5977 domain-containing protein [Chitinophaga rhizophila]MBW8683465.1 hypothetical protein [Chitinophaga rhizophila]